MINAWVVTERERDRGREMNISEYIIWYWVNACLKIWFWMMIHNSSSCFEWTICVMLQERQLLQRYIKLSFLFYCLRPPVCYFWLSYVCKWQLLHSSIMTLFSSETPETLTKVDSVWGFKTLRRLDGQRVISIRSACPNFQNFFFNLYIRKFYIFSALINFE